MPPKTIAILGAGGRGKYISDLILQNAHLGKVVAVAEPREKARRALAEAHNIPAENIFTDWKQFTDPPPFPDAAVIATMDRDHVGPAVICLDKGYHLLLEKPMGVTLDECRRIEAAQARSGKMLAVCHSMRYNKACRLLRDLVQEGTIGRIMTVEHTENVGVFHQAHSFVRGNWGNEARSTFMLLAKSCHDMDYLSFLIDRPCVSVASYGKLSYFRRDNAPPGSTDYCADGCKVESTCPFSAIKQYVAPPTKDFWWSETPGGAGSFAERLAVVAHSPYGRCVWRCDNDVVDHQVVALEFEGGITATFTMTAFSLRTFRRTHVHGTLGEAILEKDHLTIHTFADRNTQTIQIGAETGAHAGGDARVVRQWLDAIHTGDPACITTSAQESLASHTIAFAAEKSRREGRTVLLSEMEI